MSFNDLFEEIGNSEEFFEKVLYMFIISILVIIPVAIIIALILSSNSKARIYGDKEKGPILTEMNAKVVSKSVGPHPSNKALTVNMIVFELANGYRMDFAIKDSNLFGIIIEGDYGTLTYQGKRFIRFDRNF